MLDPTAPPTAPPTAAVPAQYPARDTPDAGTPRSRLIALVLVIASIVAVMVLQQCSVSALNAPKPVATTITAPDPGDPKTMEAVAIVRLAAWMKDLSQGAPASPQQDLSMLTGQMEASATSDVDKFRALIVEAQVAWPNVEPMLRRLDELTLQYDGADADKAALRTILTDQKSDALTPEQRTTLADRHGYFGKLALTFGLPDSDPQRAPLIEGGGKIIAVLAMIGCILLVAFVASVVCFIIACMRLGAGKFKASFLPPSVGGSVYLEVVAVLGLGFLGLKFGAQAIEHLATNPDGSVAAWAGPATLLVQWLLVLVCFYPLLRGVSWSEHRQRLGWTSGKGVFREMAAGVFGYFAMLPIYVLVLIVTLVVLFAWLAFQKSIGAGSGEPPSNPIAERIGSADPLSLLVFFALATIWAPLVEEAVFRGAFYRHLRSRVGVALAAIVSAICFGVMHGYPVLLLIPVISLGIGFALMREWRGSLIASMTAHALHNGAMLTIALSAFSVLRAPA